MNKDTLTQKRIKSNKFWLIITFAITAITDLMAFVSLMMGGFGVEHFIFPLVLFLLDMLLLVGIVFANFRFKYSMIIPIIYFVLSMGITGFITAWYFIVQQVVAMTTAALAVWAGFHALSFVALTFSVCDASKKGNTFKIVTGVVSVLAVALSIFYIFNLATSGFFGQGGDNGGVYMYEERTLEYRESDEGYEVVGVLEGKGSRVVIPQTFGDAKITKISCNLFADTTIDDVVLNCDADVEFTDINALADINNDIAISAPFETIDNFKGTIYTKALNQLHAGSWAGSAYGRLIAFANSIHPVAEEDKVFIWFNYSEDSLDIVEGKVLPTWRGDKGDAIDLERFAARTGVEYLNHLDANNEQDLKWAYENTDKRIVKTFTHNGTPIDGTSVTESFNVDVEFDRVFAIGIEKDNDTKYLTPAWIRRFDDQFRYVTNSNADTLLTQIRNARGNNYGFDLNWEYSLYRNQISTSARQSFTSLQTVLNNIQSDAIYIYPMWKLKAPVINGIIGNDTRVYGDSISLKGDVVSPIEGIALTYLWKKDGMTLSSEEEYAAQLALPTMSGTYSLTVFAGNDNLTSLISSTTYDDFVVTVNKKPLDVKWTIPDNEDRNLSSNINFVYTAFSRTISIEPDSDDIVGSDDVQIYFDQDRASYATSRDIKNAATYKLNAVLKNFGNLYTLTDSARVIVISPARVDVQWSEPTTFTYNGDEQMPTASAVGVGEDGALELTVSAGKLHKDAARYTATATTSNTNYVLNNNSCPFTISPKSVEVEWGAHEFEYDGTVKQLTASAQGVKEEQVRITITITEGKTAKNAGHYKAKASTPDSNYSLSNDSLDFDIAKKETTVEWTETSREYTGYEQVPTAKAEGVAADGGSVRLTVSADKQSKDVGNYTATATTSDKNYELTNVEVQFEITVKTIHVQWGNTSLIYNGSAQMPKASAQGVGRDGEIGLNIAVNDVGEAKNVGSYGATATIADANNLKNYNLTDNTISFKIDPLSVKVEWDTNQFTYNGKSQVPGASATGAGTEGQLKLTVTVRGERESMDKGTYEAIASLDDSNYSLTNTNQEYEILAKPITVEWSPLSVVYSGNVQQPTATASVGAIESVDEGSVSISVTVEGGAKKDKGTYSVTASVNNSINYSISNATKNFVITAKPITVEWSPLSVVYNGYVQQPTATASAGTIESVDQGSVSISVTVVGGAKKDKGTYSVIASVIGSNNYSISNAKEQFTINAKQIEVSWGEADFTYNGAVQKPEASAVGVGADGNVALNVTIQGGKTSKNAGDYTAVASTTNGNYTLSNTSFGYKIKVKSITVTWSSMSVEYNGAVQKPTATAANGAIESADRNSVSISVDVVGGAKKNKGVYSVTAKINSTNYNILDATQSFKITAKKLTVTWSEDPVKFRGEPIVYKAEVTGVARGDSVVFSYTYFEGVRSVEIIDHAGNYRAVLTMSGPDASNYEIDSSDLNHEFTVINDVVPAAESIRNVDFYIDMTKEEK